ncbi:MAG: ATP-dependent zinc metalloprotease FtsH, partial [Candidatus Omnitrophica bacterium]|nr:ATP-dependent zinc metalloprotease FtsH [Candidatus Omnitrophota bacterium]MBD3268850.1 ATP-dependent zinc metalloprotease FtsH [Candidatus Omnitrophota bacterium]
MKGKSLNTRGLLWVLTIAALIYYLFMGAYPANRLDISYTKFKNQLKTGNVKNITFRANRIDGEFKSDYMPPGKDTPYSYFTTVKPNALSDEDLGELLAEQNVAVTAVESNNSWLWYLLIILLPWVLIIGYFSYAGKKMQGKMKGKGPAGFFGSGQSGARLYKPEKNRVTYKDVAGLEKTKKNLEEIIEYLKNPKKFIELGATIPKGVLLLGPPGCGKTLLAKATAGEANIPFYIISGSEFIELFVGVGASRVRNLFKQAKKTAPAIIFIDEIDSIGRTRGAGLGGGHDEREQTLNQILSEMDGFEPHESVVVLAATNRPDVLDPALTRPGRFDRQIILEMPKKSARKKILQIHTQKIPLSDDVDLENLASRTVGFSGADLKNLVNEAALLAGREDKKRVNAEDFDKARDKIILGTEREEAIDEREKRLI